ncbi:transposase family protein [Microcystis aeruginosa]|uniref:transposase family protein n=1 Tax=Microcystis aeruginosa TaxID=1126 RepID=UPI0020B12DFB|nr:transposase family protein [Microcystis aeruginosa]
MSTEDQLLITLEYWREYRTYFHRGNSWGINESTAYRIVRKVENILIKSGLFNLPGKKALLESNSEIEVIVVDVSEQEIERPKKKQKSCYSGKQGYHTLKSQVVADQKSEQVIPYFSQKVRSLPPEALQNEGLNRALASKHKRQCVDLPRLKIIIN